MDRILLGHGSGGRLMHDLIRDHIGGPFEVEGAGDSALLDLPSTRIAYTTDSYVVDPLFFPGGNIGDLAVNGTVNDLSVAGAEALVLTVGFIIEEGFPIADLDRIVASMAGAAKRAGVRIVAGDTKVVNRGKADGIFINTSGIGVLPEGRSISASNLRPGDSIVISGELACHGIAVIAERNGLSFEPAIESDSRSLNGLCRAMFAAGEGMDPGIRFMRDPTRGGLATTLKETALESGLCLWVREGSLPIPGGVRGACGMLGLDPLFVANEGVLAAIVAAEAAEALVERMRLREEGRKAAIIGEVRDSPGGAVILETEFGGRRLIDMLQGEQLPRIC